MRVGDASGVRHREQCSLVRETIATSTFTHREVLHLVDGLPLRHRVNAGGARWGSAWCAGVCASAYKMNSVRAMTINAEGQTAA